MRKVKYSVYTFYDEKTRTYNNLYGYLVESDNGTLDYVSLDSDNLVGRCESESITIDSPIFKRVLSNAFNKRETFEFYDTTEKLRELTKTITKYKKRKSYSALREYTLGESKKVCVVYGLRRTGKTVLLLQAIKMLLTKNYKPVYIVCSENNTMKELFRLIDGYKSQNYTHIFIDEITYIKDYNLSCNILYEGYSSLGLKIILTGTNSLDLNISENNMLFDRTINVNMPLMTYKEFISLNEDLTENKFLNFTGTFSLEDTYNKNHEYIETSVINNIENTLNNSYDNCRDLRGILNYPHELSTLIFSIIECNATLKLSSSLSETIKLNRLGSVMQLLGINTENLDSVVEDDFKSLLIDTNYELGIMPTDYKYCIDSNTSKQKEIILFRYLERLGLVGKINHYDYRKGKKDIKYFIISNSIVYHQSIVIIDNLKRHKVFLEYLKSNNLTWEQVSLKLLEDTEGRIFENSVIYQLQQNGYNVSQFNGSLSGEIDIVIEVSDGLHLYEVKRSNKIDYTNQCKHLLNEDLINEVEFLYSKSVLSKNVIYSGETKRYKDVNYINIFDFLSSDKIF